MEKLSRFLLLALIVVAGTFTGTKATHQVGADMTWACNPLDPCLYTFTYTFYEDCTAGNGGTTTPPTLNFSCVDGGAGTPAATGNGWVLASGPTDITPLCPGQTSTCNGGTVPGVNQFVYTRNFNFCVPTSCSMYNITWDKCCRSNEITSIVSPTNTATSTTSMIWASGGACNNNSAVFNSSPVVYICEGQTGTIDVSASDPDGDILQYTMIPCAGSTSFPLNYAAGYGPQAPLGPDWAVSGPDANGQVTFTPNTTNSSEVGVMCVQVDEIRNGRVIGSIVRDMEVRVIPCNNTPPQLNCLSPTQGCEREFCVGEKTCYTINSFDADAGDILTGSVVSNPTGATITWSGTPHPVAEICWEPTAADIGTHTIILAVTDDACPIPASTQLEVTLVVKPCSPCDTLTQTISWTHTQNLLDITVTNTSNAPNATFTKFKWGHNNLVDTYLGNYTSPVTHTFPGPGTYTVCVIIETYIDDVCCHDSLCKEITVTDNPCDEFDADWYAQASIVGCTYTFFDNSSPPASDVVWDFGFPILPAPTGSPYTVTFPSSGTYTVTMYATYHPNGDTTKCCYDTETKEIRVWCQDKVEDEKSKTASFVAWDAQLEQLRVRPNRDFRNQTGTVASLHGIDGKQLQQLQVGARSEFSLDMSGLPDGIYLLRLRNGDQVETKKFVKH